MQLRINTFRFSRILGSIFSLTALVYSGNAFAQTSSQHLRFETEQGIRFHVAFSSIDMLPSVDLMVYMTENMQFNKLDSLVIKSSHIDAIGYVHIRYYHFHAHHKVVGSEVVAHYFNNKLASINGVIYKPVDSEIEWSKTKARNTALEHSAALSFKWHDPQEEIVLKLWKNDSNATYFPEGTLVYCAQNFDFKLAPVLCYVFEINADSPLIRKDIYINAVNGEVWAEEDLLHIADVQGSANTKYRGVKPITTDSTGPTSYRLRETGRGNGIETYDMKKGSNYSAAVDFTDSDNYWNNYNTNLDETATDAHYGAEMTYDYFKNTFNRNSFDDKGAKIRSYVHYGSNYSNAFWNGSVMTYGDGNGSSVLPLTSLDVCGHEVSHAVTTNTAGLIYSYESGALNESFSDIFGNAIEFYA
ncbi:MAG: bacillolysin, partial [Bacteroidia bacterium]